MISWITENVAIGEYTDACNRENLLRENIDCILNLRTEGLQEEEFEIYQCNNIEYFQTFVGTNESVIKTELRYAASLLERLTKKYKRILVHCTAGIDRAPFVVAYYLATMETEYQDDYVMSRPDLKFWITRAYKFIKEKRSQIIEHMEWV